MSSVTIRVTRTWDILVPAEYGDTHETLIAKVTEEQLDELAPDADLRQVLPDLDAIPPHPVDDDELEDEG